MKTRRRVATRSALALEPERLLLWRHLPFRSTPRRFRKKTSPNRSFSQCSALKQFLRQDYRGVVALLSEWSDLRGVLQLKKVPHYCTLCYAQNRLAERSGFNRLLDAESLMMPLHEDSLTNRPKWPLMPQDSRVVIVRVISSHGVESAAIFGNAGPS
jgi:hypothetical protein